MEQLVSYNLLFIEKFNGTPLFKNQGQLAIELIENPLSEYHLPQNDPLYNKKIGNLKVYLSQLFSDNTRRVLTPTFLNSLTKVLLEKIPKNEPEKNEIINIIVNDLIEKNKQSLYPTTRTSDKQSDNNEFFNKLSSTEYLAVFTTREIKLKDSFSIIDILLEELMKSLSEGGHNKWYRFNFPTEQICYLFWMALKKIISNYLKRNSIGLKIYLDTLNENEIISFNYESYSNLNYKTEFVAEEIIKYLSFNRILIVFHLNAPVYTVPFIALNPNDRTNKDVFCFMQNENGSDNLHKLTKDELFQWRYFVWDTLRVNNSGKEIPPTM